MLVTDATEVESVGGAEVVVVLSVGEAMDVVEVEVGEAMEVVSDVVDGAVVEVAAVVDAGSVVAVNRRNGSVKADEQAGTEHDKEKEAHRGQ